MERGFLEGPEELLGDSKGSSRKLLESFESCFSRVFKGIC